MLLTPVAWTFHFRWFLWILGSVGVLITVRQYILPSSRIKHLRDWLERSSTQYFEPLLVLICFSATGFGWLEKYTQLRTLQLNANDFWLFEDMLRNLNQGGFFLTRFHSAGIVQHGAVHATWIWALGLPLSWILGPTQAALLFGPLSLGIAAYFLGRLTQPKLRALSSLGFTLAFLFSSSVGKILAYDVHPEVTYPAMVFLWAWSLGLGDGKIRWSGLAIATLAGIGIKEDSFLVFFPWLTWAIYALKGTQRRAALFSFSLAIVCYGCSVYSIGRWSDGQWGPHAWHQSPVIIPPGADLIHGIHWSSFSGVSKIIHFLIQENGGLLGVFRQAVGFACSRQWLSILAWVPWVLFEPYFFWLLGPLAFSYSLLKRAAILNIYYSAPFLGSIWTCAVLSEPTRKRPIQFAAYAVMATCLLGNASFQLSIPTSEVLAWEKQSKKLVQHLCPSFRGLVQTPLIPWVPRNQILSEKIPERWDDFDFVFISPSIPSFEMPQAASTQLLGVLSQSKAWREIRLEFSTDRDAHLFVKRELKCPT